MKESTKAALLSAGVFPGAGHVYLKAYKLGALLAAGSFVALYYLILNAVERVSEISEQIQRGDVPLELSEITRLVSQQSDGTDSQLMSIATTALLILWLMSIADAYRVGCLRDKS